MIAFLVGAVLVGGIVVGTGGPAIAETYFFSDPMDFVLPSPCTGHEIHFVGELKTVVHYSFSPSGRLHVVTVGWFPGTTGVDLTTGQTFRYVGAIPTSQNLDYASEAPWEWTVVYNSNFIGTGPGGNLVQHVTQHLTIDARGQVVSSVENISIECR